MLQKIFEIRGFLSRGIVESDEASELLDLLGDAVDASAVALATPIAWGGFNVSERVPADWPKTYMLVRQWDPLVQRVCSPTVSTWVRGNEDLRHLHGDNPCADAFFQTFVDCLGLRVRNPYGADHCFAIYRERGKPKFTIEERDAMNLLVPHLSAALRTPTAARALNLRPGDEPALQYTVVLRYPERVAQWSPGARHLVQRSVPNMSAASWSRLDEVLFRAARAFYTDKTQCSVPIVGKLQADFAVRRAKSGKPSLLAILTDAPDRPRLFVSRPFEEMLSTAERRVARLLAQGTRLEDTSAACRISRETAKSHLKSIYRKLGIGTRAELAQLYCS